MESNNESRNERKGSADVKNGNLGASLSEPDLTTADRENWNFSGFPPGVTVDELRFYRKRRPPETRPRSSLRTEVGSFGRLKSEYQKKYRNYYVLSSSCGDIPGEQKDMSPVRGQKPEDTFTLQGNREFHSEYLEAYKEYPLQRYRINEEAIDDGTISNENQSENYATQKKPSLLRRDTNLKLEGDQSMTTEKAEKFIEYLLTNKPELIRKATNLKLEGEMDVKTETRDKYTSYQYQKRPPLCKKYTNLHMEGDLDILTENHEKYVPYVLAERPPLTKRGTNLHLEGDLEMMPEYRDVFREYKIERARPTIPINNLKTEGFFDYPKEKFVDHQVHPKIPFLRGSLGEYLSDTKIEKTVAKRSDENLKPEGAMESATESKTQFTEKPAAKTHPAKVVNNLNLEGRIDMNPEYRNAYVDYYRDGRASPTRRRRRTSQCSSLKAEGTMESMPEYRSSYIDFPRERPFLRRPEASLSSEGEIYHTTEKRSQYVPHRLISKTEPMKREPELKLEGRFECQPEYRKAYIDYLIRERVERKPRPLDNLGNQQHQTRAFEVISSKKPENVQTKPEDQNETLPVPTTTLVVSPPTITSESSTDIDTTKASKISTKSQKPPKPPARKSPKSNSISRLESSLFGTKLNVPNQTSRPNSRSTSPVPQQTTRRRSQYKANSTSRKSSPTKNNTQETTPRQPRNVSSRFGSPVRVENLACRTACTSPLPSSLFSANRRSRWRRGSSDDDRAKAFVVLDGEINNNNNRTNTKYDLMDSSSSDVDCCKKQKWMPSWYNARLP